MSNGINPTVKPPQNVDDLFTWLEEDEKISPDTGATVPRESVDELFERVEREDFEEDTALEQQQSQEFVAEREAEGIQDVAERGDVFSPQADPELEAIKPEVTKIEFKDDEVVTPSKDESNFLTRIGSEIADIKTGALQLGQRLPTGDSVFPKTGEKPNEEGFFKAVLEENRKGKETLENLRSATKRPFVHEDFEYGRLFPTEASLDLVRDGLKEIGTPEDEIEDQVDDVRSYLARNEQKKKGMQEKEWAARAEELYPQEAKIHNIYDRFDFIENLPQENAFNHISHGFFQGNLEHDISSAIWWAAATNPTKAAEISKLFTKLKVEMAEDEVETDVVTGYVRDIAKILGPMSKTIAKGALAELIMPFAGPLVTLPAWMSSEGGHIFEDAINAGVDPEEAAMNAIVGGVVSGAIEQLQVGRLKGIVKEFGLKNINKIVTKSVKDLIKKKGVKGGLRFTKEFLIQTSQEAAQKVVTSIALKTTLAEAGVSQDEFKDILFDSIGAGWQEAVDVGPQMLGITAIAMLTGISIGKIRSSVSPRVNQDIQQALEEQDLEYNEENIAKVLKDDPDLQQRIDENISIIQKRDGGRQTIAIFGIEGTITPQKVQNYWQDEFGSSISFKDARDMSNDMNVLVDLGIKEDITEERVERTNRILDEAEQVKAELNSPEVLNAIESKSQEIDPEIQESFRFVKDLMTSEGIEITNENVKKYWEDINDGLSLTEEDAKFISKVLISLEETDAQEDQISPEEISEEAGIEPGADGELRVRDPEQIEEDAAITEPEAVISPEVTPEIAPEVALEEIVSEEAIPEVAPELDPEVLPSDRLPSEELPLTEDVAPEVAPEITEEFAEEEFLTEEGEEEAAGDEMLFSISKDGRVKPLIDDIITFEKAKKDIEYFIPKELLDNMRVEYVDVVSDGTNTFENANGGIIYNRETGELLVQIDKNLSLGEQAKTFYHEIMGHAGIANVINNQSNLHKEASRLFQSDEAQDVVNDLRKTYKSVLASTKRKYGQEAADSMLLEEWMAHEMADYMVNRKEDSIGAKLWNLFKDWLVRNGWATSKDSEQFMRHLTQEMRKLTPSKLSKDFHVKYEGPAMAFSLKEGGREARRDERGKGKKRLSEAVKKERVKKKEALGKEREKRKEAVAKERKKKQEALERLRIQRDLKVEKEKEKAAEFKGKSKEEIKVLKEKHKEALKVLRRKIVNDFYDREVRIEQFHKDVIEYANGFLSSVADKNELKAFLLRIRPKTAKGLVGAKKKTLQKLKEMTDRKRFSDVKAALIKEMKSAPKEMTAAEKKIFNDIIGNVDLKALSAPKRLFLEAVKGLKESGLELSPELEVEITRLGKIGVSEMDVDDMISMFIALRQLIYASKMRQKQFINDRLVDFKKATEEFTAEVTLGRIEIDYDYGARAPEDIKKIHSALSGIRDYTIGVKALTPDAVISELLVNKENSKLEAVISGAMDKSLSKMLRFLMDVDSEMKTELGAEYDKLSALSSVFYSAGKRDRALNDIGFKLTLPSGKEVEMLPSHRIAFYLHDKNDHNYTSILQNGVVFDTNRGKTLEITPNDFEAIVKSITPQEKRTADFIHRILNTKSKEALLETSRLANGYEMDLVEDYFPLQKNQNYEKYIDEKVTESNRGTQTIRYLENTGAFKRRTTTAGGPVIIEDAIKTFYDSVKLTAGYSAYAIPLRTARATITHLRKEVENQFGLKKELDTLEIYLDDVENARKVNSDALETRAKRIFANVAQSVLGGNPWVVLRQLGSYMTIGTTGIDAVHMIKGQKALPWGKTSKFLDQRIEQYSPQIWYRITKGTINAELGDRANINEAARFFGQGKQLLEYQTIGIEKFDAFVMRRIFLAAQSEIEKNNPALTGDAKWEKITERAEYIIKETQPVYAKEHRSEVGRTKNLAVKSVTMFSSVTNQLLKSYVKAIGRFRRNPDAKAAAIRLGQDLFWINISSVAAMMGVDELRDLYYGRHTSAQGRVGRAAKYALSPIYFSSFATSAMNDFLKYSETGRFDTWSTEMATGNLVTGIPLQVVQGLGEIAEGINNEDLKHGDYKRLGEGTVRLVDAIGKPVGISTRNFYMTFIKPWYVDRGAPDVVGIARGLQYRPTIPRNHSFGGIRFKMDQDVYKEYKRLVHQMVQYAIDVDPTFHNLSDKQKEEFLRIAYRNATRAMVGNFNLDDFIKVED